ncbi:MAG: KpsF/GutQ family sugar-phosphate isomerase [Saprospiraceae bacterium]
MKKENDICKIINSTLKIEADALQLLTSIDIKPIQKAVEIISNSTNKLIVSGVGKSAIVARKMVATLNSTGSPCTFLHSADALHGDMGVVSDGDIVIVISKSGSSEEIQKLIPAIKNNGAYVIGVNSKEDSFLTNISDISIYVPVKKEADPNDLAPTASIVAHIAVCDAIAMGLQSTLDFSRNSFAKLHPAGNLGKQLLLSLGEVAIRHDTPRVDPDADLSKTIYEITSKRLGATCVIDSNNTLLGIITDGDLRRLITTQRDLQNVYAQDIMNKTPITAPSNMLAVNGLKLMNQYSISQIVVLDDDHHYVGMVHIHDLIKEGLG